jgi:hypothetical protein
MANHDGDRCVNHRGRKANWAIGGGGHCEECKRQAEVDHLSSIADASRARREVEACYAIQNSTTGKFLYFNRQDRIRWTPYIDRAAPFTLPQVEEITRERRIKSDIEPARFDSVLGLSIIDGDVVGHHHLNECGVVMTT